MKKSLIWRNQAFCFRMSLVFVFIWLAISSVTSLIIFFSIHQNNIPISVFEFSTWLFVLPAATFFGFTNAMPFILDWLFEPFEETSPALTPSEPQEAEDNEDEDDEEEEGDEDDEDEDDELEEEKVKHRPMSLEGIRQELLARQKTKELEEMRKRELLEALKKEDDDDEDEDDDEDDDEDEDEDDDEIEEEEVKPLPPVKPAPKKPRGRAAKKRGNTTTTTESKASVKGSSARQRAVRLGQNLPLDDDDE